jgi:hypothetical protein
MAGPFDIGDKIRLTAEFRDDAGALADPVTVTLMIKDPAGTVTTPTPTRSGLGEYEHLIVIDQADRWYWRWVGSGDVDVAEESWFFVRPSVFA